MFNYMHTKKYANCIEKMENFNRKNCQKVANNHDFGKFNKLLMTWAYYLMFKD